MEGKQTKRCRSRTVKYDLVKDKLEQIVGTSPLLRKLFFGALDRLFLRSRYVRREINSLKQSGFRPDSILDAGSGFGQYSFRLAKTFPSVEVIGLDTKQEIVESGNRLAKAFGLGNVRFMTGDLLDLQYVNDFDLVVNVDVLEHIEDDRKVITNIGKALKKDGLFLLTTPYFDGSDVGGTFYVDEHVRPGYSRSDLESKLDAADLNLEKFAITYGSWGNVAWTLLQKWPMGWLARRIWILPLIILYFLFVYPIALFCMHMDMNRTNNRGGGILAIAKKK
ncbi:methyltransferase type 11 [candidate division LCP-89 bacterium B3_LCP]|uniref:Methyltransferase type 11 n=1 Tax=candidate division LCP-89 bacterium B3_LCP TaxID=2012998 RepID=A0A532UZD7_UNCL8|nr:MAG: methyltransferase type 11 [candidate division LCP-89 bacterium B3_LCP]